MSRDWRIDTLRGYFLVPMTIAHLPAHPLQRFTFYTFGYASAPEGFVFLSGLVSTWVYLRWRRKYGHTAMHTRVLRRARDIYLVHVVLLGLGTVSAVLCRDATFQAVHPFQTLLRGVLLLYQPQASDILSMYCVFLLFTPIVLQQFVNRRAWLVGIVSFGLWTVAQFGLGDASSHLVPWIHVGAFNVFAWQAYFVAGQYLGYRKINAGTIPKSRGFLAICWTLAFLFFLDRHSHYFFGTPPLFKFAYQPDRNPIRFLDAACLAYIIWWVPRSFDNALMRFRAFNFLNRLGRHSLQVFGYSLFATFAAAVYSGNWHAFTGCSKDG